MSAGAAASTTTPAAGANGANGEQKKGSGATDVKNGAHEWRVLPATPVSVNTINPIRAIVDKIVVPPCPADKPLIPLSIGDPTFFGNLPVNPIIEDALINAIKSKKWNGYGPAHGIEPARAAIAKRYSPKTGNGVAYGANDVLIASGCSGALTIAITAVAAAKENILIPRPGFSLYETVCGHYNIEAREYNLLPEKSWEADVKHMESLVDANTRAVLINNPANPTGSNYTKEHLIDILRFADRHKLVIIADEIYADIVFGAAKFHALAGLVTAELDVPILTCGGFAKQYLAPGWRMGWCMFHDFNQTSGSKRAPVLSEVREGANRLSQLLLGATTILQAALPEVFEKLAAPQCTYYADLNKTLAEQAAFFVSGLKGCVGLNPITPEGAMYVMTQIDTKAFKDIESDRDFAQKLLSEEFVYVLPGSCFHAPNFFRVVFCAPTDKLKNACDRIRAFCQRHAK